MKPALLLLLAASVVWPAARMERYALLMEDAPLASKKSTANAAAVASKHAVARAAIAQRGFRITAQDQKLVNAIFVQAPSGAEATLRAIPGVAFVERLRPMKMHLDKALDLMNVPAAWSAVNGSQNAGAGVKIAIIDSGIDHRHPAFSDAGMRPPDGFPKCRDNDCAYVNNKVVVARSYVNMLVGTEPEGTRPDDLSPRDRVGHGTAVAMIAAGRRNTGPAAAIEGVAPAAWLGNYKVFGSPGVNGRYTYDDVIIQALSDAITDGMDVAVLSLGSPAVWGPRDTGATCDNQGTRACDWRAEAVENATVQGLTVVVSSGNTGDYATRTPAYTSVETPGSAPAAITVGATTNSHIYYQTLRTEGASVPADLRAVNTLFGNGPGIASPLQARIVDVAQLGNDGKLCEPVANGSLDGAIALVQRGDCQLILKVQHAQRAGAVAVVIYQEPGLQGVFPMRGLEETGIPAVLIGNANGNALKNYIAANSSARVTLDPALIAVNAADPNFVAWFSSRGPSIREVGIKPEIVAVGTDIYTATQTYDPQGDLYNATGYASVQGTSFAAPLAAGVAALVKQRNPGFTPAQVKSALVNTANPNVSDYDGNRAISATVFDMGAGKLNAENALRTNVTIEPSVLSFGVIGSTLPNAKGMRICNTGSNNVSLRLGVMPTPGVSSNVRVTVNRTTLNLNAGQCADDVAASLTGSRPAPGVYEGVIQIEGGAVSLRVPYAYLSGDGVPYSILPLENDGFEQAVGTVIRWLTFKVVDRYGVPIPDLAVRFQPTLGGGAIVSESRTTDDLGIGWAEVRLGNQMGEQEFYAAVGDNREFGVFFSGRARLVPTISTGGVVNAASGQSNRGYAPGSYITIWGRGLSEAARGFNTPYLPLSLAGVSVSFDVPSQRISVPGRVTYVSDQQVNVQIPWELQGVSTALMKISIGDTSSDLFSVPIANQSPAFFEYTDSSGRLMVAALNSGGVIGSANAARRGEVVSLFVNGLGAVDVPQVSGEVAGSSPLARTTVAPEVTIGGQRADVSFSGLAPGNAGLYQVNVTVPAGAPAGVQQIVITANGIASKTSNIAVQ